MIFTLNEFELGSKTNLSGQNGMWCIAPTPNLLTLLVSFKK